MVKLLKKTLTCVVAGVVILTSIDAFAGCKDGETGENCAQELGLTTEQKDALKENKDTTTASKTAIRGDLKEARGALREELKKPDPDSAVLDKAVSDIKTAQGDLVDARVESFLAMKEIVTDEQFQKMSEMKKKQEKKRKKELKHRKKKMDADGDATTDEEVKS